VKRLTLVFATLALLGCGSGGGGGGGTTPAAARVATPTSSHVVVIVMENKEYGNVIGQSSAPYANSLARRYALLTHSYGVTHPSLPNYFALTAGTTFGVHTDCTSCQQSGTNLVDQLEAAGVSWKAYMGAMPSACFKGATSGRYAKKHNPFMYYPSVAGNPKRCAKVVPGARILPDAKAGRLPAFSFLSPDLCDDTHDCGVSSGDRFLADTVPTILSALGPHGFLILTYDEGSSNNHGGGQIATTIAGPPVKRGAKPGATYTHYSVLRTIEDAFRLKHLRHAGDAATKSISAAFKSGVPHLR
jgi:hypothetical protein